MEIKEILVSDLQINRDNDRHGSLRDETASIQWLLEKREHHMRALASDLATSRKLYERPLVRKEGDVYGVYDGNRRTSCIKLLLDPAKAPSEKWREFFATHNQTEMQKAFHRIECEVESDLAIIEETLYRRHTGSQDGVGQSQWDPEAKSNFLQRTGKDSAGLAETIEKVLKAENLIGDDVQLPRSNLDRLLSAEPIRKRAGVSFSGGTLVYLGNKDDNLKTLQRIANDLSGRKIVLGDLWNNVGKNKYLDQLKTDGLAIDRAPAKAATPTDGDRPTPAPVKYRKRAPKDKNLILHADDNPFVNLPTCERADRIWRELQFHLEFDIHDNAIAVLMRVLLDLAITHYGREQGIAFSRNHTFAQKVSAVADSMQNRGFIDSRGRSIVRKFESDKPIVSAHSMHQYVHNSSFHPGKSDLKSIWNVIRPLIINSTK
jgi:hypothetical protein